MIAVPADYPLPAELTCPDDCDPIDPSCWWLNHRCALRADLAAAMATGNDHDAEVLDFDLKNVEQHINDLLAVRVAKGAARQ